MMNCNQAQPLLAGYLDGELSEAQSGPVRTHLLACCACREWVQEGKTLSRWFRGGQTAPEAIPQGFSARIARRAFAGDPGLLVPEPRSPERPLLPFLLKWAAVAALVLFVLALQIQRQRLPDSHEVEAESYTPPWVGQAEMLPSSKVLALPAGADLSPQPPLRVDPDEQAELDGDAR